LTRLFAPPGPPVRLAERAKDRDVYLAQESRELDADPIEGFSGHVG
jgi:hypothetical protein